jgi:hypothetical protein
MKVRRRVRNAGEVSRDRQGRRRVKQEPTLLDVSGLAASSPRHNAVVRTALTRLRDLSDDVAGSLRANSSDKLRKAASLAVIGTLALLAVACDEEPSDIGEDEVEATVSDGKELTAEVSQGLPTKTNQTYKVNSQSLMRDDRGVYYFEWTDPATNKATLASVSNLRLVESKTGQTELQMPANETPILSVPADVPIALTWRAEGPTPVETAGPGTPTATVGTTTQSHETVRNYYHSSYGSGWSSAPWFAFGYMAGRSGAPSDPTASRPAFRDPPPTSAIGANQPLSGSVASESPKPFTDRAVRSVSVSGMQKGTGSGTAVTGKASGSKVAVTGSGSAASSKSVRSPSSSGFSSGKSSSIKSSGSSSSS